ncbi:hypothetical protein Tco_0004512 [Tanacetum coccineum]
MFGPRTVVRNNHPNLVTMADANINAPEVPVAADSPPTQVDILKNTNVLKLSPSSPPFHPFNPAVLGHHQNLTKTRGHSPLSSIFASREKLQHLKDQERRVADLVEDKINLALHTEGKKKVNPLVISGVRFTKLIINHLQSIHKFHKRPGSPLHLPYEESALGYLKFSFKNTKRVVKKRTLKSSQQLVDEFVDEGVPADEPRFEDEEADIMQKVMEESLKDAYLAPQGLLPPVVIREPGPGKFQPLPEVQGKGKEKVSEEQAAQVLLNLQTPKKKNPAEQFIFQRCTPATTEPSSLVETSSLYAELEAQEEGQGGTNPGNVVVSQTPSSHVVHAGPNLDHMDLGIAEASSQPNTEQMDEDFTATTYLKVQENLKLPIEGDVRLEDPASQCNLKTIPEKSNTEVKFKSLSRFPIPLGHPRQFLNDPLWLLIHCLSKPASERFKLHYQTSTTITIITYTNNFPTTFISTTNKHFKPRHHSADGELERCIAVEYIHKQETVKEAVTASVQYAMRAPLRARFKDLPTSDMKEILLQRMLEENYDKGHEDHWMAYEALQKSILRDESEQLSADKAKERKKMKRASGTTGASDSAQDPLPPPQSPTTNPDDQSPGLAAPGYERPATPEPAWSIPSSSLPVPIHNWASALASSYMEECHKLLTNQVDNRLLRYNVSRPLPLGGHPGQVTIQTEFFFNRDLDYLRFGSKGDRLALSITKMKAVYYPDVGLEQMVPDQMWIKEECMYDISATYGISHWIEVFSIYGYDYMKKIVLRRADNQEYTIAENDFKDLYPSDFEDLYLLNLQGHLNHLPPRDKKILSTTVNLWIRNLEYRAEFMHDYKILDSPRAVLFRDKYGMHMLMRFNEIHKFSDDTLQQIDEALDYWVKEFKVNKNNQVLNTSSGESSGTWKALLVEEYAKETTDFYGEPNDDIFSVASRTSCVVLPPHVPTISNIDAHVEGEQFHESKQSRNRFNTYAVRITWLIADMEDKYHGPSDTLHNPP